MFWQDLDPGYYQNPAAYTYLVYGTLRVLYGPLGFLFDLPYGERHRAVRQGPRPDLGGRPDARGGARHGGRRGHLRGRAAPLGRARGTRCGGRAAFAFLPVAYSRVAVTDVGALAGVALALMWSVRARRGGAHARLRAGRRRGGAGDRVQVHGRAGAAAAGDRGAGAAAGRRRAAGAGLAAGGAAAALVFALLNPYLFGSFGDWWTDLRDQADVAANDRQAGPAVGRLLLLPRQPHLGARLGRDRRGAWPGAVLVLRRRLVRGLVLVALPLALFAYLALQSRYFGRWLLPAYPALAMLAAVAVVRGGGAGCRARWQACRDGGARAGGRRPAAASRTCARRACSAGRTRSARLATCSTRPTRPGCGCRSSRPCRAATSARTPRADPVLADALPGAPPGGPSRVVLRWRPAGSACATSTSPGLFVRPDGGVRASAYHAVLGPA